VPPFPQLKFAYNILKCIKINVNSVNTCIETLDDREAYLWLFLNKLILILIQNVTVFEKQVVITVATPMKRSVCLSIATDILA